MLWTCSRRDWSWVGVLDLDRSSWHQVGGGLLWEFQLDGWKG